MKLPGEDAMLLLIKNIADGKIILMTGKNGQMIYCSPDNLEKIKEVWRE